MILADTSVWIDHLRFSVPQLRDLLNRGQLLMHPFVTAELALGLLSNRSRLLTLLDSLPQADLASTAEVRSFIEKRQLFGMDIGLIDVHLLASALIRPDTLLWTRDRQLRKAAEELGVHSDLA